MFNQLIKSVLDSKLLEAIDNLIVIRTCFLKHFIYFLLYLQVEKVNNMFNM